MGKSLKERKYFLVDNGSLGPDAVLNLRTVAHSLAKITDCEVRPMGLMHSHKVEPSALDGLPGESMEAFLQSDEAGSMDQLRVLPFFLGPSLAVTDWLPRNLEKWRSEKKGRSFAVLDFLFAPEDDRLARILADLCLKRFPSAETPPPHLILVDHGTPLPEVNRVREEVGQQLEALMRKRIGGFSTCCMERRPGKEYDFNDPLLENLLRSLREDGVRRVLLAQFFLSPGRHAGENGDLARICKGFEQTAPGFEICRLPTMGNHPLMLEILADRILKDC